MTNDLETKSRPLVIDGQLWQTTAWDRGMGKYTLALFEAYSRLYGSDNITVVHNSNLEIKKERMSYLKSIMPKASFTDLKLPAMSGDIAQARKTARGVWNNFVKQNFDNEQVDFLILNIFTFDYCAAFPDKANKMFIFYDLLPLAYWRTYSKYFSPSLYFAHFNEVFEADLILSISEDAKNSLVDLLAIDPGKIINISGAHIKRDKTAKPDNKVKPAGRYLLMPTSDFPNKNNLNAVIGFAKFNEIFGNTLSLVITSNISDDTKNELSAYSENLIFSGGVSDEELGVLFEDSELVLFTPITEGLGLPILEAVACNKPVVCSDIEVFKEVSTSALYFCNQDDTESICEALVQAFTKENWDYKSGHYKEIIESFTWDGSAKRLFDSTKTHLEDAGYRHNEQVVFVMPSPDEAHNSLGQLIQSAYGYTSDHYITNYFTVSTNLRPAVEPYYLNYLTDVKDVKELSSRGYSSSTKVIYAIDESEASSHILMYAIARPGIILLDSGELKNGIHYLISTGYLNQALATKVFGQKFTDKDIREVLEKLGNRIIDLKQSYKEETKSGRLFGKELTEIIKSKRS